MAQFCSLILSCESIEICQGTVYTTECYSGSMSLSEVTEEGLGWVSIELTFRQNSHVNTKTQSSLKNGLVSPGLISCSWVIKATL